MDFIEEGYWDTSYENFPLGDDHIGEGGWINNQFLNRYVPKPEANAKAFEIGCFPGRHLPTLSKMGFQINGIDSADKTPLLRSWLEDHAIEVGEIHQGDFFALDAEEQYDLVCSFGFIEHFEDYHAVMEKHLEFLKPNGTLVITVPNFYGVLQYFLHRGLDYENLLRHNIKSMNPSSWIEFTKNTNLDLVILKNYGHFYYWDENDNQNIIQKTIGKLIKSTLPITSRILPKNHLHTSPFLGLVARKK